MHRPAAARHRGVAHIGQRRVDAVDVVVHGRAGSSAKDLGKAGQVAHVSKVGREQGVDAHDEEMVHGDKVSFA